MDSMKAIDDPACRQMTLTVEVTESVDPNEWDSFIFTYICWNPIFAASQWADYLGHWARCEPRFVSVYNGAGERVAAWLLFLKRLSTFRHGWKRIICRGLDGLIREAVWFAPPVVVDLAKAASVSHVLAEYVRRLAWTKQVFRIAGGPWMAEGRAFDRTALWATYVIDCRGTEAQLWSRLKSSARKAIRRAREKGVGVRRIHSRDELDDYYRFAERVARCTGRTLNGLRDFQSAWDCLRGVGHLEFFVAEHKGEYVSGLGIRGYGTYVTEFGLYQSQLDRDAGLNAQDLIKWEIIRWANANGIHTYDLAGVNPQPSTSKETGIRQFKEKWGGVYVKYPIIRGHWITGWKRSGPASCT